MMLTVLIIVAVMICGYSCGSHHLMGNQMVAGRNVRLKSLLNGIKAGGCRVIVLCNSRGWFLVSLAPILEPIAHLGQCEARLFGQGSLFVRRRISVSLVANFESVARLFLETIHCHLAVPDAARQRVLLSNSVLIYGAQLSAPQSFGLSVVGLVPEPLQFQVILLLEFIALQQIVQGLEVGPRVGHMSFGSSHYLAAGLALLGRQRGQKSAQLFDVLPLVAASRRGGR